MRPSDGTRTAWSVQCVRRSNTPNPSIGLLAFSCRVQAGRPGRSKTARSQGHGVVGGSSHRADHTCRLRRGDAPTRTARHLAYPQSTQHPPAAATSSALRRVRRRFCDRYVFALRRRFRCCCRSSGLVGRNGDFDVLCVPNGEQLRQKRLDRASASAHRSLPSLRWTLHRIRRPLSSSDDRLSFAAFAAADVADVRDSAFGREAHPLPVHDRVHRELRPATDADLHDGTIVLTRFLVNRVRLNQLRGEDSNLQPSP